MRTEVTVIGAGPGGMAAALQLKRSGIEPLLLEKELPGGLLLNANLVENYPGFPHGISGEDLVGLFVEHLRSLGVQISFEEVTQLDHDGEVFIVKTNRREFESEIIVLASGTKPKALTDCAISTEACARVFCTVYPLRHAQGKKIVIIGAGDAAFDYALRLAPNNTITVLNRGERRSCLPLLWERAKRLIDYRERTMIHQIKHYEDALLLDLRTAGARWTLKADYAILAIGRVPQLDFLSLRLREQIDLLQEAGVLYLVGDVCRGQYRQTAIAVGDGIAAAMRIYQRLKEGL